MAESPIRKIGPTDAMASVVPFRRENWQEQSSPSSSGVLPKTEAQSEPFSVNGMAAVTEDGAGVASYLLKGVFGKKINPEKRKAAMDAARATFAPLITEYAKMWPGRAFPIDERRTDGFLRNKIAYHLHQDPNTIFVFGDPYIALDFEDMFPGHIYRVSGTRTGGNKTDKDGKNIPSQVVPRPGEPPFQDQIQAIDDDLKTRGLSLEDVRVIFGDDSIVSGSTERDVLAEFEKRGIHIDSSLSLYGYIIGQKGVYIERPNAGGINEARVDSKEQREQTITGGTTVARGQHVALQEPAQAPWGDGSMNRLNSTLHLEDWDRFQNQQYRNLLAEIEQIFAGEQRTDGSTFEHFTLADFRWKIPTTSRAGGLGASEAIRQHRERYFGNDPEGNPNKMPIKPNGESLHLDEIRMLDVIDHALKITAPSPERPRGSRIGHVVESVNGTQLALQYPNENKRRFTSSELGKQITGKVSSLIDAFHQAHPKDARIDSALASSPLQLLTNQEFVDYLQTTRGELAFNTFSQRFIDIYGEERGRQEMSAYLEKYKLPPAYITLQELTWGEIDLETTHVKDPSFRAKAFNEQLLNEGVRLTFLSEAPWLEAIQILQLSGQADLVLSGKATLITEEDLIDPTTLRKRAKVDVIDAFARKNKWGQVLSIGDQPTTDTRPVALLKNTRDRAMDIAKTFLVSGPQDLAAATEYIRTPAQKMPSQQTESAEGAIEEEQPAEESAAKAEVSYGGEEARIHLATRTPETFTQQVLSNSDGLEDPNLK